MKSFRLAVPLFLAMCALGAYAYQGSMPQAGQSPQMSGAASQGVPGGNPQHPGATPPYAPSQTQTPDSTQNPAAQTPSGQPPQAEPAQPPASRSGESSVDNQVSGLTTALNLTPDQQAKLRTILEDQHQQVVGVVNDSSLSHDAKMDRARALRDRKSVV